MSASRRGRGAGHYVVIKASGILIVHAGKILLVRRSDAGDHPGTWCVPGGKIENAETALEAAIRETFEETGIEVPAEALVEWTRAIGEDEVDFTTFVASVAEEQTVTLSDESSDYGWFALNALPEPLHYGMAIIIERFSMDELDIAQAMSKGRLASPSVYQNLAMFNIRITGTGLSYRIDHDEYVWRDPSLYVNDRFLKRCSGLIVIWEHPEGVIVDSTEFSKRIVGTVFLPHVPADKPDEVWAVVKLYDDAAIQRLVSYPYSTSPSVKLRKTNNATRDLNGETLLIEGTPALLDHIALCEHGVWDKGGPPDGVESADIIRADSATRHLHNVETHDKHSSSLAAGVSFAAAVMAATRRNR